METYSVFVRGGESDDVVIRTLVGEYDEEGSNHGRKVYKKAGGKGPDDMNAYMYYWDERDGPSFTGWWFGNQVGGSQVWSHCPSNSQRPPKSGWKIPWNSVENPSFTVMSKAEQVTEANDTLKATFGEFADAVSSAKTTLGHGRTAAEGYATHEALRNAEAVLVPGEVPLNEVLKKIADLKSGQMATVASTPVLNQLTIFENQLKELQKNLTEELEKVRGGHKRIDDEEKERQAAAKEVVVLDAMLPEAVQKTNQAEDQVERALILAEMIQDGSDNWEDIRQAVTQTENAVQEAQKAISEARIFLNSKSAGVRRFVSESIRQRATDELGKLQAQLQDGQTKLNPFKTVRQDFNKRKAAQELVTEVLEKLAPAEVDVDKAEEATMLLSGEDLTKALMQQAQKAVTYASDRIAAALAYMERKKATASETALAELEKLEERAMGSQERLAKFKELQAEATERVDLVVLVKEAADKLVVVQEAVEKAAEAEAPFLMGVEDLPTDQASVGCTACDAAIQSANTTVSTVRMFMTTKMVEVKRFSLGPSQEAQSKLKEHQLKLEQFVKRLNMLKVNNTTRKHKLMAREAELEVAKAEDLVAKVGKAASFFANDKKVFDLSAEEIKEAADEVTKAEAHADQALNEARRFISERQLSSKNKDSAGPSSEVTKELIKLQARLSTAKMSVVKYKKISASVEQKLAAKKKIEEANVMLQAAEEKVAKATELATSLRNAESDGTVEEDAAANNEKVKEAEAAAAEAQAAVKTLTQFVEAQAPLKSVAPEEVCKLEDAVAKTQQGLDEATVALRERADRLIMRGILREADMKVGRAEDSIKTVSEVEARFLASAQETDAKAEDANKNDESKEEATGEKAQKESTETEGKTTAADLDAAIQAAQTAIGGVKAFLAKQRVATKKIAENVVKEAADDMKGMQSRVDAAARRLQEIRKAVAERKLAVIKVEATKATEEAERKLNAAAEATAGVSDESLDEPGMQLACKKAGQANIDAQEAISSSRELMLEKQKDLKMTAADSATVQAEVAALLEKVAKMQIELEKQKKTVRDQEHCFVAKRLLQSTNEMVEKLEKKIENGMSLTKGLPSDPKEDVAAATLYTKAMDSLKAHMKKAEKEAKALYDELSENKGSLTMGAIIGLLQKCQESEESKMTEDELKTVFARMDAIGSGELSEDVFLAQMKTRYVCQVPTSLTEKMKQREGKVLRKLGAGEILEALGEPTKDEELGSVRVQVKVERDGAEGYVTLSGHMGQGYLEPYSHYSAREAHIERTLQDVPEGVKEAMRYMEKKGEELRQVRSGPLADAKATILGMRPRIVKVQYNHSQIIKTIGEVQKKRTMWTQAEKTRLQMEADKKAAAEMMEEANKKFEDVKTEVDNMMAAIESLIASKAAEEEDPLKAMEEARQKITKSSSDIEGLQAMIKSNMLQANRATKGTFNEARSLLSKLEVKVTSLANTCKKQAVALKAMRESVETSAHDVTMGALKKHLDAQNVVPEEFFKEQSQGGPDIPSETLRKFIEGIPDTGLTKTQLDLGLFRYRSGVTKLAFWEMFQVYQKVVQGTAITSAFKVKDGKTLRKLAPGELLLMLESEQVEDSVGLPRVKCCALTDMKEGWVTTRGNQGTSFLEKTTKPYYGCQKVLQLHSAFESSSSLVRAVKPGEVFELLEGPRKEPPLVRKRVKCKAAKDGLVGYVTQQTGTSSPVLEQTKVYVCTQPITITTTFDINVGKAVRKIELGEVLELQEDPQEDPKRSFLRAKAKASKDGAEGWVTLKGNQGTTYVEQSKKHLSCKQSVALDRGFGTGSGVLRALEEGEIVEVIEGASVEKKDGDNRLRGRNLSDGTEGWFTLTPDSVKPWSSQYTVAEPVPLMDGPSDDRSKEIRKMVGGESIKALDTPVVDADSGAVRVRVRTDKDGATGFATVRSPDGKELLVSVACKA